MKFNAIKQAGGVLIPASDTDADELTKLKTGGMYEVEVKQTRNPAFHRKVFAFLQFCFSHWKGDREFISEREQFEVFRNHMTVLAGYYHELYNINGDLRIEAKSISYGSMSEQDFQAFYNSMIQVAMRHIFNTNDEQTLNRLYSFF